MSEVYWKYREEKNVTEKTGKGLQNGNIELNILKMLRCSNSYTFQNKMK